MVTSCAGPLAAAGPPPPSPQEESIMVVAMASGMVARSLVVFIISLVCLRMISLVKFAGQRGWLPQLLVVSIYCHAKDAKPAHRVR